MTKELRGKGASFGKSTGEVRLIKKYSDLSKVKEGDILVSEKTTPAYEPAMAISGGIITEKGTQISHAAIMARELGIPCVVGLKEATGRLKEGEKVTVNGKTGLVQRHN